MRASYVLRLFLVAAGIPAAIRIADERALRFAARQDWSALAVGMIYALFVAQIGLLGFAVGRFVDRWFLRWIVLLWALALVDTMLFRLVLEKPGWGGWHDWGHCLPYALLSGQLGLVAIWGAFGPVRWPWRLPGFFVAAILVMSFGFALGRRSDVWVLLTAIQGAATVGLCVLFGRLGFRLRSLDRPTEPHRDPFGNRVFQFSIGHMLLWMAALVPILLLVPQFDLGFVTYLALRDWLGLTLLAVGLGIVSLTAVWAALGSQRAAARIGALALGPILVAAVLKLTIRPSLARNFLSLVLGEIGWGWVAWTLLSAWFLTGLLLMFRASGYRLVRTPRARGTGPAAKNVSSG